VLRLLAAMPQGTSELYLHPASARTSALVDAMPGYRHMEELAALVSPQVRAAITRAGIPLIAYGALA